MGRKWQGGGSYTALKSTADLSWQRSLGDRRESYGTVGAEDCSLYLQIWQLHMKQAKQLG